MNSIIFNPSTSFIHFTHCNLLLFRFSANTRRIKIKRLYGKYQYHHLIVFNFIEYCRHYSVMCTSQILQNRNTIALFSTPSFVIPTYTSTYPHAHTHSLTYVRAHNSLYNFSASIFIYFISSFPPYFYIHTLSHRDTPGVRQTFYLYTQQLYNVNIYHILK